MSTPIIIADLIAELNAAVKDLVGTRVEQMGELRERVTARIQPILEPRGLYFHSWAVHSRKTDYKGKYYEPGLDEPRILSLDVELRADERAINRRGRLLKCEFVIKDIFTGVSIAGETVEDVLRNARRAQIDRHIDETHRRISEAKVMIRDCERSLIQDTIRYKKYL